MFSTSTFLASFGPLFWAARFTLLISLLGIGLGLVIGALICAAALSRRVWLRRFAALWVSFLRGVPLLVQLLLCYYLLPVIGINVPALVAAVVTVGICSSAYVSEIWRGAIIALPPGQAEAATAIGMGPRDIWTRIILPQAVRIVLPPYGNITIMMLKDSSLASTITVSEITRAGQLIASSTFKNMTVFTLVAFIYLVMSLPLTALNAWLERRFAAK